MVLFIVYRPVIAGMMKDADTATDMTMMTTFWNRSRRCCCLVLLIPAMCAASGPAVTGSNADFVQLSEEVLQLVETDRVLMDAGSLRQKVQH